MSAVPSSTAATLRPAPNKRKRCSSIVTKEHVTAVAKSKQADPVTALEVDIMILEYQAYDTTQILLETSYGAEQKLTTYMQQSLEATNAFISVFKYRHPALKHDETLRARLLLLQFCALFCSRLIPTTSSLSESRLQSLREANVIRAKRWIGSEERIPSYKFDDVDLDDIWPLSQERLEANKMIVMAGTRMSEEEAVDAASFYGGSDCTCLLDILPLFIQTCTAIHNARKKPATQETLQLISDFMLHSCLEQYLIYGAHGFDAIDEAFAWGIPGEEQADGYGIQDPSRLFANVTKECSWPQIRDNALAILLRPQQPTASIASHFHQLAKARPMLAFEADLKIYLMELCIALQPPVLVQVEQGYLAGMEKTQSDELLRKCGLSNE
ncbi:hypothetical protein MRB53_040197 [Persea americana]|nr:hypothetical protein MRB53_040197 [Persea americana]